MQNMHLFLDPFGLIKSCFRTVSYFQNPCSVLYLYCDERRDIPSPPSCQYSPGGTCGSPPWQAGDISLAQAWWCHLKTAWGSPTQSLSLWQARTGWWWQANSPWYQQAQTPWPLLRRGGEAGTLGPPQRDGSFFLLDQASLLLMD